MTSSPSFVQYRITGKERDTETGLDYFGARYYGSKMGRFVSPDPTGLFYADPTNPQSLGLYTTVRNNPVLFIDPNGEFCYQVIANRTVNVDNTAQSSSDCSKGATWVDGIATSYWYGADGVLQIGYQSSNASGTLGFSSPDISRDSLGAIQNPWLIDLTDQKKYGDSGIQPYDNLSVNAYQIRYFGTHWCGPGGGGPPKSPNDAACREHDRAYAADGVSAAVNAGVGTPTPAQVRAMKAANQAMYDAVQRNPAEFSTPFLSMWLTGAVGHIYPGTEAQPASQ